MFSVPVPTQIQDIWLSLYSIKKNWKNPDPERLRVFLLVS